LTHGSRPTGVMRTYTLAELLDSVAAFARA
jgi:hypothetical protein